MSFEFGGASKLFRELFLSLVKCFESYIIRKILDNCDYKESFYSKILFNRSSLYQQRFPLVQIHLLLIKICYMKMTGCNFQTDGKSQTRFYLIFRFFVFLYEHTSSYNYPFMDIRERYGRTPFNSNIGLFIVLLVVGLSDSVGLAV